MHESNDMFGLIAVLLQFGGFIAMSIRAWMLRRQQVGNGCLALGWSGVLVILSLVWIILNFFDLGSVWASIGNGVDDIPVQTTLRIAVHAAWEFVFYGVLSRLAESDLKNKKDKP